MSATLSILGLYNYDPTIFDGFAVPNGLDRRAIRDSILLECAELEIVYPQPATLKHAIALWSASRLPQWDKLYKTTTLEYNPIENYNRIEDYTDTSTLTESRENTKTLTGNDTQETSLTGKNTTTGNDTTNNSVVGFNGAAGGGLGESLKDKSETASRSTAETKGENTGKTTINRTDADSGSTSSESSATRHGSISGNIGVTTSQQMIQQERDVAVFNITDYIVRDFKQRFCILVY